MSSRNIRARSRWSRGIKTYHKGTSTLGRTVILAGCRSDWGIDYEFLEEWLQLADEGVEE